MSSGLFKLNWKDALSALISAVVVAVLTYLGSLADIYATNWSTLLNIAALTGITSLLKSFTTDNTGHLLGAWKIK